MYAFFIVRGLRRKGGLAVRAGGLRLILGVRGIAFQDENTDAQPFWERVVATDAVGDRWQLEKGTRPEGRPPDICLRVDSPASP
jgi:hypothetical protein